jgi:hypothetical protein
MKLTQKLKPNNQLGLVTLVCALTGVISGPVFAETPQKLSAKIAGITFESDDASILYLMPSKGVINIIASTKGASAYPPPKTPIDRLSIICRSFESKPVVYTAKDFGSYGCEATFTKGESKKPFGDPEAEYRIRDGKNSLEITSVKGKVIEGKFSFEMIDKKTGNKISITDGVFKVEDRQL